ncbi:MAG: nucleotidyltransferase family protein, partial [Firmicutes bacterium]|nr:nucleotidyltransferase family protein [Bacillota bacterium]
YAVRDGENFAVGAVNIIHRMKFITRLSFGAETTNIQALYTAAHILEEENEAFRDALQSALSEGKPFAAAQAAGLAAAMDLAGADSLVSKPNNILGICYLRALQRLQSEVLPLPVRRAGDFHSLELTPASYPSASAVRKAYLAGDIAAAEAACGYAFEGAQAHKPDALDSVLINTLRSLSPTELKRLPDCSEGLEHRLAKCAAMATSRAELLDLLKTKRYTRARLNRLLTHALLGVSAEQLETNAQPSYVRLLGFRKDHESVLSHLNRAEIPVIAKASDGDLNDPLYRLDERAYDLWALGARLPAGLLYRQQIAIE